MCGRLSLIGASNRRIVYDSLVFDEDAGVRPYPDDCLSAGTLSVRYGFCPAGLGFANVRVRSVSLFIWLSTGLTSAFVGRRVITVHRE